MRCPEPRGRIVHSAAAVLVLVLMLAVSAACPRSCAAEDAPTADAEEYLRAIGFDALDGFASDGSALGILSALLTGDAPTRFSLEDVLQRVRQVLAQCLFGLAKRVLFPMVIGGTAVLLLPEASAASRAASLCARIACALMILSEFDGARQCAAQLLNTLRALADAVTPMLTSALALSDSAFKGTMLTSVAALCSGVIQRLISTAGMRASCFAALIAVAGNLSDGLSLRALQRLTMCVLNGALGLGVALYGGAIAVCNALASPAETAGSRAVRYAFESIVPVIGGEISASLGMLGMSAQRLRSAVGVTGMILLAGTCAEPLMRLLALLLSLKILGAVAEPIGDRGLSRMFSQFGDAVEMLTALCAGSIVLLLILLSEFCAFAALA